MKRWLELWCERGSVMIAKRRGWLLPTLSFLIVAAGVLFFLGMREALPHKARPADLGSLVGKVRADPTPRTDRWFTAWNKLGLYRLTTTEDARMQAMAELEAQGIRAEDLVPTATLMTKMVSTNLVDRMGAAQILARRGTTIVPLMRDLATHSDPSVRWSAVGVLDTLTLDRKEAGRALVAFIPDPDAGIRARVAQSFLSLDRTNVVGLAEPALERSLANTNDPARLWTALALGWLNPGSELALQTILDDLSQRPLPVSAASREFWTVVGVLGHMGETARPAVPLLKECLQLTNDLTRCQAAGALWEITHDAKLVVPVLDDLIGIPVSDSEFAYPPGQARRAMWYLGRIGPEARGMVPRLTTVAGSTNIWARFALPELEKIDPELAAKLNKE